MTDYTELKLLAESHAQKDIDDPIESTRVMLVEPAAVLALIAENERLQGCVDVLRNLASHVGAGGYNASEVDPEVFARKILDGINILSDPLAQLVIKKGEQIDQLRAEIAGLKTGYEAYEAQSAALRKALSDCSDELAAEIICKHGGQKLEDMHPVTRRLYERDMASVTEARAAMVQGERA